MLLLDVNASIHHFKPSNYSARWVLRPASVRGVEVAKPSAAAKARAWISDQVVNDDDFLHQI